MKIAILGCGFISEKHAEALARMGYSITLAVDSNIERAKQYAQKWNVERYGSDANEALSDDIDIVHVCTPPTLHYGTVKALLLAGKHVICEKPMCLTADEARELMNIAKENGLINAVDFNVRFHDACARARDVIQSDDFGNINLIHGTYMQEFHALPADYLWRYEESLAGKMRSVTEIGSHWIDIVRNLTGLEIKAVSATFGKFDRTRYLKDGIMVREKSEGAKKIEVNSDDAAIVTLRFNNGAIGSMVLSEVSHGRSNYISVEITGSKKSLWWNTEDPYRVNTSTKFSGVNSSVNAFEGGYKPTFEEFFKRVYTAIATNGSATIDYPTFYDGYVNAAVCEAILKSANSNSEWVEVE